MQIDAPLVLFLLVVSHVLRSYFIHTNLCVSVADLYNTMFTTYLHVTSQRGEMGCLQLELLSCAFSLPGSLLLMRATSFSRCLSVSACIPPGQITGNAALEFTALGRQGSAVLAE